MPKYYHVHLGRPNTSQLENKFMTGKDLFFSKKDSFWYRIWPEVGLDNYGAYVMYEIYIPNNMFTTSFNPKFAKNKILKITKKNIAQYKKLYSLKCGGRFDIFKAFGYIGIDATASWIKKGNNKGKVMSSPEGILWRKIRGIKIKKIEVVETDNFSE